MPNQAFNVRRALLLVGLFTVACTSGTDLGDVDQPLDPADLPVTEISEEPNPTSEHLEMAEDIPYWCLPEFGISSDGGICVRCRALDGCIWTCCDFFGLCGPTLDAKCV